METAELVQSMRSLSNERREAQRWHVEELHSEAEADFALSLERAKKWQEVPDGTAKFKEHWIEAETAELKKKRDIARGLKQAALEKGRGVRSEISMFTTYMARESRELELHQFDEGAA